MISKRRALLFLWIFFLAATASPAETLKVFSWNDPIFFFDGRATLPPGRGQELGEEQIQIGQGGGISFEGSQGTRLSIIGPALLRFQTKDQSLRLDYGDLYVKGTSGSDLKFVTGAVATQLASKEFFIEVGINQKFIRLRNLGSTLRFADKEAILQGQSFYKSEALEKVTLSNADDLNLMQARHQNNRDRRKLSEKIEEKSIFDPDLTDFFDIGLLLGVERTHYRGSGGLLRLGRNHFFHLPKRRLRLYYMNYPAFRYGLQAQYLSTEIFKNDSRQGSLNRAAAGAFVGLGWLQVFLDLSLGYQIDPFNTYQFTSPFWYQGQLGYRFDLQKYTDVEAGITLEACLSRASIKYMQTQLSHDVWFFGLVAGLSMKY